MDFRTLNELFQRRVEASSSRRAYSYSKGGRWLDVTWTTMGGLVDETANGLMALGLRPGDTVAILGETRPEWCNCDLAVLAAGGRSVGIYQTESAANTQHILVDANARFVLVDTLEQLAKIESLRAACPALQRAVLWDGTPPPSSSGFALTYDALRAMGREHHSAHPSALSERRGAANPQDPAILIYTSGTTGFPKGAVLTHKNITTLLKTLQRVAQFTEEDVALGFLPMAHVAERVISFYSRVATGMQTVFARSLKTVVEDIQYARPTIFGSVPRIFEKVYAKVQAGIAAAPLPKRKLAEWALGVGRQVSRRRRAGEKKLPRVLELQLRLADKLVLSKIRDAFGGRVRYCIVGAAPTPVEILEFFHACGILILEVYGLTEVTGAATANRPDDFRFGTVGKSLPGVQLRIAEDGEILIKGDTVFPGYLNLDTATHEAIDGDGWFHSGDVGEFDQDGFLRITDRKKNLIVTAGGKNVAPANVEALLKKDPLIGHAIAIGDRRPYLIGLFSLDPDAARNFAAEHGISGDMASLAKDPKVRARLAQVVDAANRELARYEQVRKFAVLPSELTTETGELTPSLKVKRKVVEENFRDLIDSLYRDGAEAANAA